MMKVSIRSVTPSDIPQMAELLLAEAERRRSVAPSIWAVTDNAREMTVAAVEQAFTSAEPSPRQIWLVAEFAGRAVGVAHSMLLPVPPIYTAEYGEPGLVLDDSFTTADAPPETVEALLSAVETALYDAGAKLLVASCLTGSPLKPVYDRRGYEAVTLYMGKSKFDAHSLPARARSATPEDVPAIVAASAHHRCNLARLDPFWVIHPDADARFCRWMQRSLTLTDRDMFVSGPSGELEGYAIAQPIARLLVPPAHDIEKIGVLDDYDHEDFADTGKVGNDGVGARDLLAAAERAFAERNYTSALVVCPAAWRSKISILQDAGYQTAKIWMVKR
ncbi:MAG: hypothetical protein KTR19_13360 [Hyphomicrobiales bacterium]|nr:hypothetical protein [Hyphomicrobiales bacterium]